VVVTASGENAFWLLKRAALRNVGVFRVYAQYPLPRGEYESWRDVTKSASLSRGDETRISSLQAGSSQRQKAEVCTASCQALMTGFQKGERGFGVTAHIALTDQDEVDGSRDPAGRDETTAMNHATSPGSLPAKERTSNEGDSVSCEAQFPFLTVT
jgi:hypothetical protein